MYIYMQRINRPLLPHITSIIFPAPENVEHPVGRRREAHAAAPGGAGAEGEGAGWLEMEEQQEGNEQPAADCVCGCASRSNTNRERATGRRRIDMSIFKFTYVQDMVFRGAAAGGR
jgi:hypothetical protein